MSFATAIELSEEYALKRQRYLFDLNSYSTKSFRDIQSGSLQHPQVLSVTTEEGGQGIVSTTEYDIKGNERSLSLSAYAGEFRLYLEFRIASELSPSDISNFNVWFGIKDIDGCRFSARSTGSGYNTWRLEWYKNGAVEDFLDTGLPVNNEWIAFKFTMTNPNNCCIELNGQSSPKYCVSGNLMNPYENHLVLFETNTSNVVHTIEFDCFYGHFKRKFPKLNWFSDI
jgi:hypothetical protein